MNGTLSVNYPDKPCLYMADRIFSLILGQQKELASEGNPAEMHLHRI